MGLIMSATRRRTKRTLHIDDDKLERAAEILGTTSTTKIVDEALQRLVAGKPRVLGRSGKPSVARNVDAALGEAGFGAT
jgi:Arc/MetJ family transcription regulator